MAEHGADNLATRVRFPINYQTMGHPYGTDVALAMRQARIVTAALHQHEAEYKAVRVAWLSPTA